MKNDIVNIVSELFKGLYPKEKMDVYQIVNTNMYDHKFVVVIRNEHKIEFTVSRYDFYSDKIDYVKIFNHIKEESDIIFKNIDLLESRLAKIKKLRTLIYDKNL